MQFELDIKQFKKQKRISKGSFGLVYQIEEKKTGELYAAKIIDCDDNEDKCNEMVNREISILMYTKHPTIIKFIGYSKLDFQEENNITIIMELATNGSLREVLRQIQGSYGPKNYTNTTRQIILVGIARGMKYLHDRHIIHRDIKPENILLDENLQPHITDFGLSKFYEVGHSHSQTKFGGTLAYEAPEILNKQKYDLKVDVYSFSILMFEVLTDSVPYPELESGDMPEYDFTNKVVNQCYRPKFSVPVKESMQKLIEECWSENPSDRPAFDEIFNKLANKTGREEEENFLLEDVDIDELNLYVENVTEITDNTEKLLSKISSLEEDNKKLKSIILKLKTKYKEQSDTIKTLEEDNKKLKSIILKLKTKYKKQSDTIKILEEDNKQLQNVIKKLKAKDKNQSDTIKAIEEENRQIKSENSILTFYQNMQSKLKAEINKMPDTNKDIKEKGQEKSKIDQNLVKKETEKSETKQTKTKEKKYETTKTTIIVGGYDECNQLGEKPKNKSVDGNPVIFPPLNLSLDSSSLLSYSVCSKHSVLVTRSGSLFGIGDNSDGRISSSHKKTQISQFTEFSIKDNSGSHLAPISSVCSYYGTLYMLSKISDDRRQLVYCDCQINGGDPIFLDIGDVKPMSLFGGWYNAAAISDKGEVIFINRNAVKNSPNSRIAAVSLPDGEKASSVACLKDSIVVLSTNGRVFSSFIEWKSSVLRFLPVSELCGYEIVWVSGTYEHCLAVSKEGRVFGDGSNEFGQLGLSEEKKFVLSFTEILSLLGYKIRAAYAGSNHSLFETQEGKILSCGSNCYGELLLSSGPSKENVYSPRETTIKEDATFCIAGWNLNSIFIGGYPPPNTPNMPIQHNQ